MYRDEDEWAGYKDSLGIRIAITFVYYIYSYIIKQQSLILVLILKMEFIGCFVV